MSATDWMAWAILASTLQKVEIIAMQVAAQDIIGSPISDTNRVDSKLFAQAYLRDSATLAGQIAKAIAVTTAIRTAIDANPVSPVVTDNMIHTAIQNIWPAFSVIN